MTKTDDHIRPLALDGDVDPVALARARARALKIYVGAIAGAAIALGGAAGAATMAYRSAVATAAEKVQAAKNKSEAGFQVTKQAMEELQERVLVLERAAQRAQVAETRTTRGSRRRPVVVPPPVPVVVTTNPKALPSDLDRAEKQVYKAAPPKESPRGMDALN